QGAPSEICSTIELVINGSPIVYRAPKISLPSNILINPLYASITPGSEHLEVRYTTDGSDPNASSSLYEGPIPLKATTTIRAGSFEKGGLVSSVVSATV